MKLILARVLMQVMVWNRWLLNCSKLHRLFSRCYAYRIRQGDYKKAVSK